MNLANKLLRLSVPLKKPNPAPAPEQNVLLAPQSEDQLFPLSHPHGRVPVGAALRSTAESVCTLALDESLRGFDPSRMLLLDTETTGLAGGTGTLPFIIGLGFFEEGGLRIRQLVLRRPGQEKAPLEELRDRLARASCLVTYNGKTFDWPLLKSRFVMNRMPIPAAIPHLDLLHCARRVYRHRQSGARLVQLEAEVLGHARVDDIPGAEIPERYFRYLRSKDEALLAPILEHNVHDMLLLAAMLGHLCEELQTEAVADPRDLLGYAQLLFRAGDSARALRLARTAAATGHPEVQAPALTFAALLCKRSGAIDDAVRMLQRALTLCAKPLQPSIHLSLAKLKEHSLRSPAEALAHARCAAGAEPFEDHAARIARLERKTAGMAINPTMPLALSAQL